MSHVLIPNRNHLRATVAGRPILACVPVAHISSLASVAVGLVYNYFLLSFYLFITGFLRFSFFSFCYGFLCFLFLFSLTKLVTNVYTHVWREQEKRKRTNSSATKSYKIVYYLRSDIDGTMWPDNSKQWSSSSALWQTQWRGLADTGGLVSDVKCRCKTAYAVDQAQDACGRQRKKTCTWRKRRTRRMRTLTARKNRQTSNNPVQSCCVFSAEWKGFL